MTYYPMMTPLISSDKEVEKEVEFCKNIVANYKVGF